MCVSLDPTISIIVPIFNAENHLEKTVDSILAQTFEDFELILINDGSNDQSLEICNTISKRDPRVQVISKKNSGVSSTRNKGLEVAKGSFISFVDSDDYLAPVFYENLIEALEENTDADFVMCGYTEVIDNKEGVVQTNMPEGLSNRDFIVKNIIDNVVSKNVTYGGIYAVWNKLYKRSFIGNLKFDETRSHGEDWWFNICLFDKANAMVVINQPLYYYVINTNENSLSNGYNSNQINVLINTYRDYKKFLKKYNLSQIDANTTRLREIVNQLAKARLYLNRDEFKVTYNEVIDNERFHELVLQPNKVNGLHSIALRNINNFKIVSSVVGVLALGVWIRDKARHIRYLIKS